MLQSCARVTIGPRGWNSYFACGFTGYLVGLALAMVLAARAELGPAARAAIAIGPPAAFLALLRVTTRVLGRERIVFYEYALIAIAVTAALAGLVGAPPRVALDLATLGVGTFLAFGRIGCLRVGCCHGRPARRGIRYGRDHVHAGFEARLRDVPLLPVQLADGVASAALTVAGVAVVVAGSPGHATAIYVAGYAVSRFALELLRGDARPYGLGLSEAQWTAVVTPWLAVALAPGGFTLGCASVVALAAALLLIGRRRRWPITFWLTNPRHLRELDALLRAHDRSQAEAVAHTTEGLRVSLHRLSDDAVDLVASHGQGLSLATLRRIGDQLGARWQVVDAFDGRTPGLVHLVLRSR